MGIGLAGSTHVYVQNFPRHQIEVTTHFGSKPAEPVESKTTRCPESNNVVFAGGWGGELLDTTGLIEGVRQSGKRKQTCAA
jgi:hypothetical protein